MSRSQTKLATRVGLHAWTGAEHGWGKIGAIDHQRVRVDFFESPAAPKVHSIWLTQDRVAVGSLPKQTRVLWEDNGRWHAGRVLAGDVRSGYAVRKSNSFYDIQLEASKLWVRWSRPIADPVQVLLAGANESPYYSETRLPFLRAVVAQRAACSSVPAILSSAIELYPHQLQAALQVLRDPVQRYLLADEVGLGKTIEAGIIARQLLLDEPDAAITVIAPDSLRRQWQSELRQKFFIDDFPRARIRIVAHEDPSRWHGERTPTLVIVDEAHHLVGPDAANTVRVTLAELCHASPRLLLLSATPALHHEQAMLGLLHLLDPAVYQTDDLDGFTARVRSRHGVASAFYALDPTFPDFVPLHLLTIRAAFPADTHLESLADEASDAAESDVEALPAALDRLRAYVNETYRLHRRVIRHRRDRVLAADGCGPDSPRFEVTGRQAPNPITIDDTRGDTAEQLLEKWRQAVRDHLVATAADEATWSAYAWAHAVLVERCRDLGGTLTAALAFRLGADGTREAASLDRREAQLLRSAPVLPADEELRQGLDTLSDPDAALSLVANAVRSLCRHHRRLVVFAGATSIGRAIVDILGRSRLSPTIASHLADEDPAKVEQQVDDWLSGKAQVLVCDRDAEEGRNFQAADAVVHLNLPLSVNRFEQRLGRVDRHGDGATAAQYVLLSADEESIVRDWLHLLRDGFGAFAASLSMLQYSVEEIAPTLFLQLLRRGSQAFAEETDRIAALLTERRKEIAAEDVLEATFTSDDNEDPLLRRLDLIEGQWHDLERTFDNLACDAKGSLQLARVGVPKNPGVRSYLRGSRALLPVHLLAQSLPGSWDQVGCFNRTAALRRPGTRVLRLGSPTVETLLQWAWHDDRGQATAFWRRSPGVEGDQVSLGFDYIVDADINLVTDRFPDLPAVALRRRLDGWFVPFTQQLWLDPWTTEQVDPDLEQFLRTPYDTSRGDKNLNADRIPVLFHLFGGTTAFREVVLRTTEAAKSRLGAVRDIKQRATEAEAAAARDLSREEEQRRARAAAGPGFGDKSELADEDLHRTLRQACRQPRIRLIAVSCVVTSNRPYASAAQEFNVNAQ